VCYSWFGQFSQFVFAKLGIGDLAIGLEQGKGEGWGSQQMVGPPIGAVI
jgi:hypothetical protein